MAPRKLPIWTSRPLKTTHKKRPGSWSQRESNKPGSAGVPISIHRGWQARSSWERKSKKQGGFYMAETIGQNISIEIKDGKAIITIDLAHRGGLSRSEKPTIVASIAGNVPIPAPHVFLGLTASATPT